MSRCIDADALEPDADYYEGDYWAVSIVQIHNAPTIEPRCETCEAFNKTRLLIPQPQRKKGKWIKGKMWSEGIGMGETYGFYYTCSECNSSVQGGYDVCGKNFCEKCGADNRGDGEKDA